MPGRAAFYPESEISLKHFFYLVLTTENSDEYNAIAAGQKPTFSAEGTITLETAWTIIEKEFTSSI